MRVESSGRAPVDLGIVETAPTIGIIDYSRRSTDAFGVTTVVQRGFQRTMTVRLAVDFDAVDGLERTLADLRATTARWVADDRYAWLSAQGYYKDFSLDLATAPISYCTLTVQGLTQTETVADAGGDPAPGGLASTLRLLQPIAVTDAVLVASSVAENDAPEWNANASYGLGARVTRAFSHLVYESAIAGNSGHDPANAAGQWLEVGPTNRWAMFDQALGTATTASSSISVGLGSGAGTAIALLDVVGSTARVQAAGYDQTQPVGAGTLTFLEIPAGAGQITVTVAGPDQVAIGTLLIGKVVALGITEASATAGITDYSRKDVDEFGVATIVPRAWAKRMTAKALIRSDAVDAVANRIATVRAVPSLWMGQDGSETLTIYGFFKDFSIQVDEGVSVLSLSIEGLSRAATLAPLTAAVSWPNVGDPIHTKPDDNAVDTRLATAPIFDRTAQVVAQSLDLNASGIIQQALRQDDAQKVIDASTFVDGQPVSVVFVTFRNEQKTTNSAINSVLTLLGAKTSDGTGFVIDSSSVQIGGGKTLAQKFTEIGAASAANKGSIASLQEAVIGPDGSVQVRAVLELDVNGRISGTRATNNGALSEFDIVANVFRVVDPGNPGALPTTPFSIVDGIVRMHSIEVDKIKVGSSNTLTSPVTFATAQSYDGSGSAPSSALQVVASYSITMASSGTILILLAGSQNYYGSIGDYGIDVAVDGAGGYCGSSAGATFAQASFAGIAAVPVAVGQHTIEIRWRGSAGTRLNMAQAILTPVYGG